MMAAPHLRKLLIDCQPIPVRSIIRTGVLIYAMSLAILFEASQAMAEVQETDQLLAETGEQTVSLVGDQVLRFRYPRQGLQLITVSDQGMDTQLKVFTPEGVLLAHVANWRWRQGRYYLLLDDEYPAEVWIEISRFQHHAKRGSAQIKIQPVSVDAANDDKRMEAYRRLAHAAQVHLRAITTGHGRATALEMYTMATNAAKQVQGPTLRGDIAFELGEISRGDGQLTVAAGHYQTALQHYVDANDGAGIADSYNALGLITWREGNSTDALEYLNTALEMREAEQAGEHIATVRNNIGLIYKDRGAYSSALDYLNRALDFFQGSSQLREPIDQAAASTYVQQLTQDGDLVSALNTLNNIALVHDRLGNIRKAERYWRNYLAFEVYLSQPLALAKAQHNFGVMLYQSGRLDEAIVMLVQSLDEFERLNNGRWRQNALSNLGLIYSAVGDYETAIAHFTEALPLAVEDRKQKAATLRNMGAVALKAERQEDAARYLHDALMIYEEITEEVAEAGTRSFYGEALLVLGDPDAALVLQQHAHTMLNDIGARRDAGRVLSRIGNVHLSMGRFAQAREVLETALQIHRDTEDILFELETLSRLVRAVTAQDQAMALAYAEEATALAETIRIKAIAPELQAQFMASRRQVFEEHVNLLMAMGRGADAWIVSERSRGRSLLDLLESSTVATDNPQLLELRREHGQLINELTAVVSHLEKQSSEENQLELRRVLRGIKQKLDLSESRLKNMRVKEESALTQLDPSITSLQALIDEQTLVLSFFLGEQKSYVWAIARDGVNTYTLPAREKVAEVSNLLVTALRRQRTAPGRSMHYARELSQMILAPLAGQLHYAHIAIMADGVLHHVPFGLLPNPGDEANEPLIKDSKVSYLSSAGMLQVMRRRDSTAAEGVAVLADPVFGNEQQRGVQGLRLSELDPFLGLSVTRSEMTLPRLPGARYEAESILKASGEEQVDIFTEWDASHQFVINGGLQGYRVIHFATHGVVNPSIPSLSGLVLAPTKAGAAPGYLRPHEITGLGLVADMVVLSGCETGVGKSLEGEGLMSLTRPFFVAGARQVVSSLWKVSDKATAALMEKFYQYHFGEGKTAIDALRTAQNWMRSKGRWHHPYNWAGFVIHGDWQGSSLAVKQSREL